MIYHLSNYGVNQAHKFKEQRMRYVMQNKYEALTGNQNKRLNNVDLLNNSYTAPLTDIKEVGVAGTTTPPEEDVIHAKEWVDEGSLL